MLRLAIEYVPINMIKPAPNNARTHTMRQKNLIAASIKRFGIVTALGVDDDNQLVYGHGRLDGAILAGETEVPVVRLGHLTADERRAYLLADNRIAEEAGWDRELLALELQELQALDFDLPALGFNLPELDSLFEDLTEARVDGEDPQEDDLPPTSKLEVSRPGDLWLLGNHRLLHGDARVAENYELLLDGEEIGVIFADPPYNVKIKGNVSGLGRVKHSDFAMASGEMTSVEFVKFLTQSFAPAAERCRNGAIAFISIDWRHMHELREAGLEVFDELKNVCIWNKKQAGMGSFYRSKYEMIMVFKAGTAPHINTFGLGEGGRQRSNVWDYAGASALSSAGQKDLAMHPTVKPVALIVDALKDCSARSDIVLDNFGGSGSTLIAAQKCGRRARLIEYEAVHCDTTIRRWQNYTGKVAMHANGSSFEEIEEEEVNSG
jgi:DNA modification methylase